MRRYNCPTCGNEIYFENMVCVNCGGQLGYSPLADEFLLTADGENTQGNWDNGNRSCANRDMVGCNWLVATSVDDGLCSSCQRTLVIPDLTDEANREKLAKMELAKRMMIYSIHRFGLPLPPLQRPGENQLRFEFKSDFPGPDGKKVKVVTGHDNGLITVNIAEADDAVREKHRKELGEPYRTLVGHFRHEVGHFYWDRLVQDRDRLDSFRSIFGDERQDYGAALERHYQDGPPMGWNQTYVSSYATSHPWEDFAETWAHYFHMVDGLDTAAAYGLPLLAGSHGGGTGWAYRKHDFQGLLKEWVPLTVLMNAMNRSIGNSDFYPFVLSDAISGKLLFIHELIHQADG